MNYLNDIQTPMIFINAKDDPIVPEELLVPIQKLARMLFFFNKYNQEVKLV